MNAGRPAPKPSWFERLQDKRDRIINGFVILSFALMAISLDLAIRYGAAWRQLKSDAQPHATECYYLLAFWVAAPPLYFLAEYFFLPPTINRERTEHFHDLCRNVWVAFVVILAAIMGIDRFPGF